MGEVGARLCRVAPGSVGERAPCGCTRSLSVAHPLGHTGDSRRRSHSIRKRSGRSLASVCGNRLLIRAALSSSSRGNSFVSEFSPSRKFGLFIAMNSQIAWSASHACGNGSTSGGGFRPGSVSGWFESTGRGRNSRKNPDKKSIPLSTHTHQQVGAEHGDHPGPGTQARVGLIDLPPLRPRFDFGRTPVRALEVQPQRDGNLRVPRSVKAVPNNRWAKAVTLVVVHRMPIALDS